MATTSEGTFKRRGIDLYTKTWTPTGPVRAKLVFVHGFNEHVNRYNDFFSDLAGRGIQVFAWDQQGWGRSVTKPADRGLTGPTSVVVADVAAFVQDKLPRSTVAGQETGTETQMATEMETAPVFVMGHSMGGGEVLVLAGDTQYAELVSRVRGWIVECPLVGFPAGEEPGSLKVLAGRLVGRLLPRQQLKHVVPPEYLSRDAAIVESVRNDALCHNTGTLEGLASLLDRTAMLSSGQVRLGKQVRGLLLAHGTQDRACSYEAAIKFVERQHGVDDKTSRTYDGAYHQLHSDHCKDDFAKDLTAWILERCPGKPAAASQVEAKL